MSSAADNLPQQEIYRYRGDASDLAIPLTDPDAGGAAFTPGALTHILICTIKAQASDADAAALVQKRSTVGGITVANPSVVTLLPEDFSATALQAGVTYELGVKAVEIATGKPKTVARGTVYFETPVADGSELSIATVVITPPTYEAALGAAVTAAASAASSANTSALAAAASADAAAEFAPLYQVVAASSLASSSFVCITAGGAVPANAGANLPAHGFVRSATAAGEIADIFGMGALNGFAGLGAGATYFLSSAQPGQPAATPPSAGLVQILGVASAADTILVEIDSPVFPVTEN